ncbi:MAG: type II secretion system protein [Clostridiaceae bacterium]|nr:type II secretion system protein [Clostridiaceae bacterium]
MLKHTKKGFTLIELILVVAILGVVVAAIMTFFQFTTRSYTSSDLRSRQQYESRMAMDQVKKKLGIGKNVVIRDVIPATLPTDGGYCYYDSTAHLLRLRSIDGREFNLMTNLPSHLSVKVYFVPVKVGADSYDTVRLEWQVGDYGLNTDVFIQNRAAHLGSVTTSYDIGDTETLPGIFIEFN